MGENPNAKIMKSSNKTSEMGENPNENKMNNLSTLKNAEMEKLNEDTISHYTITNINVDWDSMGISEEENNEETSQLGIGSGWVFKNGKIYINSSEFGEDDEFIQLIFVNNMNQTLEELYDDFDNISYDSGILFKMFRLYVEGFKIEPLNDEMAQSIYKNTINIKSILAKKNYLSTLKKEQMENRLKEELVEYLFDESLETLTQISTLENRFVTMWNSDNCEDDKMLSESKLWSDELKEQWGKLSLIMKLFKDFDLDEGRNSKLFKESKVGGDCFYSVANYEVKIDDRNLSKNRFFLSNNEISVENFENESKKLETIKL